MKKKLTGPVIDTPVAPVDDIPVGSVVDCPVGPVISGRAISVDKAAAKAAKVANGMLLSSFNGVTRPDWWGDIAEKMEMEMDPEIDPSLPRSGDMYNVFNNVQVEIANSSRASNSDAKSDIKAPLIKTSSVTAPVTSTIRYVHVAEFVNPVVNLGSFNAVAVRQVLDEMYYNLLKDPSQCVFV